MPKILPPLDDILKQAGEQLGKSTDDVLKDLSEAIKQRYGSMQELGLGHNELAWLYFDSLGVKLTINVPMSSTNEYVHTTDVNGSVENFNIRGHVVSIFGGRTRKGTQMYGGVMLDEKGSIPFRIYGDGQVTHWETIDVKVGDAIYIIEAQPMNPTAFKTGGKPDDNWVVQASGNRVSIQKIKDGELGLQPLKEITKTKIVDLKNERWSSINGIILKTKQRSYIGCAKCRKRTDVAEGVKFKCIKCGDSESIKITWTSVLVGDGSGGQVFVNLGTDSKFTSKELDKRSIYALGNLNARNELDTTKYEITDWQKQEPKEAKIEQEIKPTVKVEPVIEKPKAEEKPQEPKVTDPKVLNSMVDSINGLLKLYDYVDKEKLIKMICMRYPKIDTALAVQTLLERSVISPYEKDGVSLATRDGKEVLRSVNYKE